MNECFVCKDTKYHGKTCGQTICFVGKEEVKLFKCTKCQLHYHYDCAFNHILTQKTLKNKNPFSCPSRCGEVLNVKVPYEDHNEYNKEIEKK